MIFLSILKNLKLYTLIFKKQNNINFHDYTNFDFKIFFIFFTKVEVINEYNKLLTLLLLSQLVML